MTTPKCPKCENSTFEMIEINVKNADYKLNAICCTKCKSIIGVQEYYNVGELIQRLAKKLNVDINRK